MMTDFGKSFQNRKVLVTGHTGFKGAWLSLWLHQLGARVTGYALPPPTNPSLFRLCRIDNILDHHIGDVRDGDSLSRIIDKTKPDFVFHLAAQSLVRASYEKPLETLQTNIMGTANLLAACRYLKKGCAVVVVTSDKCYENREVLTGYRETDPMGGSDPYSASKGCAELVTACWRKSFFKERDNIRIASARAGNVIGGGDWAKDRIVPDCIAALQSGRPIVVRNPEAVRPWQHVLDPLFGYMTLAARLRGRNGQDYCSGWNFGPQAGNSRTVALLVNNIIECWGAGSWRRAGSKSLHEATLLSLDCKKARKELGWRPKWNFPKTVRETTAWYKAWDDGEKDLMKLCIDQIRDFETIRYR